MTDITDSLDVQLRDFLLAIQLPICILNHDIMKVYFKQTLQSQNFSYVSVLFWKSTQQIRENCKRYIVTK